MRKLYHEKKKNDLYCNSLILSHGGRGSRKLFSMAGIIALKSKRRTCKIQIWE